MNLELIPKNVRGEYPVRQVEAMVQWLDFLQQHGKEVPYDCRWWLDEFKPTWARSHTFRNCMYFFIRIVESL